MMLHSKLRQAFGWTTPTHPLMYVAKPLLCCSGVPVQALMLFTRLLLQDFGTQYEFAIQTLSTVILTTFQLRCQTAGNSAATCAYRLPVAG